MSTHRELRITVRFGSKEVGLQRDQYLDWAAWIKPARTAVYLAFLCGHSKPPRFKHDAINDCYNVWLEHASIEVPLNVWNKLKAWVEQVTQDAPEGANRGVNAEGSQTGPDAAAGKPDVAVEGVLQPLPLTEDGPHGLQRAGGSRAPAVQEETRPGTTP